SVLALWSPQCNAESWRKGIMTRIEMLHPRSFHAALQAFTEIQRKRFDQHFIAFAKRLQRRPLARTFGSLWPLAARAFIAGKMPRRMLREAFSASCKIGNAARKLSFSGSPA